MTIYYDYDKDDWDEVMGRVCKCGHKLYMHGFTMGKDFFTEKDCINASICTKWKCDCKGFERAKEK